MEMVLLHRVLDEAEVRTLVARRKGLMDGAKRRVAAQGAQAGEDPQGNV
jgi:hypothetical protein